MIHVTHSKSKPSGVVTTACKKEIKYTAGVPIETDDPDLCVDCKDKFYPEDGFLNVFAFHEPIPDPTDEPDRSHLENIEQRELHQGFEDVDED